MFHLPTFRSRSCLFENKGLVKYFLLPFLLSNILRQLLLTLKMFWFLLLNLDFQSFIRLQVNEWKLARAGQDRELEQVLEDVKVGDVELVVLGHLPPCQPHHRVLLQCGSSFRGYQHLFSAIRTENTGRVQFFALSFDKL